MILLGQGGSFFSLGMPCSLQWQRGNKGSNKVAIKTNASVVLSHSLWDFIWNLFT